MKSDVKSLWSALFFILLACSTDSPEVQPIQSDDDLPVEPKIFSIKFTSSPGTTVDYYKEYNYQIQTEITEGDTGFLS